MARSAAWVLDPARDTDCFLCGCDEEGNGGGDGAFGRVSFLALSALVLFRALALCLCCIYAV